MENQKALKIREFPQIFCISSFFSTPAQIGAVLGSRNTTGSWIFLAQFAGILDHFPYNLQPMEIQNIARTLRAAGNFRGPLEHLPTNQNTPRIAHFYPISTHFAHLQAEIEMVGIRKIAENSRILRTPSIFRIISKFPTPAHIGALLDIRDTIANWLFWLNFETFSDRSP